MKSGASLKGWRKLVDRILLESDASFTKGSNEKYTIAFNDEIYKYIGELYHQENAVVRKRVKANFAEVLKIVTIEIKFCDIEVKNS